MWVRKLKYITKEYRNVAIKLIIALFFIYMIVQYNTYGKRSNAHFLNLQIMNGMISELCIAPSANIGTDKNGVFAKIKERKIYIPETWGNTTPHHNTFLAMITDGARGTDKVYQIDSINARLLLLDDSKEGCRAFYKASKSIVR